MWLCGCIPEHMLFSSLFVFENTEGELVTLILTHVSVTTDV